MRISTGCLSCATDERQELSRLLLRAVVVRVTTLKDMSTSTCCDSHDGEAPLARYLRITDSF